MHKLVAMKARGANSGQAGVGAENASVRAWSRRFIVQCAAHGMKWGPERQFSIGSDILELRDYRSGRKHLRHPYIAELAPLLPRLLCPSTFATVGKWVPAHVNQRKGQPSTEALPIFQREFLNYHEIEIESPEISFSSIRAMNGDDGTMFDKFDAVAIQTGEDEMFFILDGIFKISCSDTTSTWVTGTSFKITDRRHAVRDTKIVRPDGRRVALVQDVLRQVCIIHSCPTSGGNRCRVRRICTAHNTTNQHMCPSWSDGWWHNTNVKDHELCEKEHGFVAGKQTERRDCGVAESD